MSTTKLENVINRVHEMSINHFDETVAVKDMEFDSIKQMWVAGEKIEVMPSAQRLLANRLRVPFSYLERCPENLQSDNLNYWIEEEQKNRDSLFCRFDGNKLRAVFTNRYEPIDHMEILSKMLEYGFQPDSEVQYQIDNEMLVVKLPEYGRAFDVQAKDTIVPGISFSNSEVGTLAFSIETYFFRLVCSNGLIVKAGVSNARFKHISRKALDHFSEILTDVALNSQEKQNRLLISTQTSVQNPSSTITAFNRQFNISKDIGDAVIQAWETDPVYTMFGIINAYTHLAKASWLSAPEAYQLEKTGGMILALVKH